MRLPDRLLSGAARERRAARQHARQARAQGAGAASAAPTLGARRPAILVGLMALLALAGVLLTTRVTTVSLPARRPQGDRAMADLRALRTALERFRIDCGRYPAAPEGLRALVRDKDFIGWRGPYVNKLRADPWFRPYVYRLDGQAVTLLSLGPDGREGTADDVAPASPSPEDVAGPEGFWRTPAP
jgi:general secretion pathway protein G